ncbi:hypothetical protein HUJ04_001505 [Dendroctonus ponderosae]|nr:hypothetical protein HUJ04_001505 [Dendroctonus ponderosae]
MQHLRFTSIIPREREAYESQIIEKRLDLKRPTFLCFHNKTKSVTTSKEPIRCNLVSDKRIVQQANQFMYRSPDLTSNGNLNRKIQAQMVKSSRVSGCWNEIIWENNYLTIKKKARICKGPVRPICSRDKIKYHKDRAADRDSGNKITKISLSKITPRWSEMRGLGNKVESRMWPNGLEHGEKTRINM